jgi:hypothetical protein
MALKVKKGFPAGLCAPAVGWRCLRRGSSAVRALLLLAVSCGAVQGCDGDGPLSPGEAAQLGDLRVVSGNGQVGQPGERLSEPLKVRALDNAGRPMVGVAVQFSIEEGNGAVSSSSTQSGAGGEAQTFLTLGPLPGTNRVSASASALAGLPPTFAAQAEGPETDGQTPALTPVSTGAPASLVLVSADPASIGVRGSGANETAVVTFEVPDEMGRPVADGEPVFFRLDVPAGADERVQPSESATVGGRVQAAVSSGTVARTLRLIAEATTSTGDTVRSTPVPIAIHGGLPDGAHFSIALQPVNLAGRVLFGLTSSVTAYVFDRYSNPVLFSGPTPPSSLPARRARSCGPGRPPSPMRGPLS